MRDQSHDQISVESNGDPAGHRPSVSGDFSLLVRADDMTDASGKNPIRLQPNARLHLAESSGD